MWICMQEDSRSTITCSLWSKPMDINSRISALKGVGEKTEKLFAKLGVHTIQELLSFYPRSYEVYEKPVPIKEAEEGKTVTISGVIFGRVVTGGRYSNGFWVSRSGQWCRHLFLSAPGFYFLSLSNTSENGL